MTAAWLGTSVERLIRPLRHNRLLRRWRETSLGQRLAWRIHARLAAYEPARQARLVMRRRLYSAVPAPGLFSLITPVWDTDPVHLQALADSVFGQDGDPPFEWVIHDNASTDPRTLACLAALAAHPAVTIERSRHNLGIIGGMRRCLERAGGRYVLPLDHDDYLYPDALRIVAWHLAEHDYPALLYTDEDKLYGTQHCYPFFKPDWDPVLFVNASYIAHLCALDRQRALALGVYSDRTYEGCHDWDSFLRFWQAGDRPAHVPEVLYGWRIHPGSTSGNIRAKDYVYASQRALLKRFVAAARHPERYEIEPSPLFPGSPNWHIRRLPVAPRPMVTIVIGDPDGPTVAAWRGGSGYQLQRWAAAPASTPLAGDRLIGLARAAAAEGALVRLLADDIAPLPGFDDDAVLWEAVGLFELFADTAMVGGRIVDPASRIRAAGAYFGFGLGCDCPDVGRRLDDPGYQGQMWQQRSVGAVAAALAVIEPGLLIETLEAHRDLRLSLAYLGAWCGAQARRGGRRVVYSPFLAGRAARWDEVPAAERAAFLDRHRDLVADEPLLSPRLDRAAGTRYRAV
jgi:hypothetical protein